jgi:hypothetical protein
VNLIYYGNQRQLEYDFVVAPGARVSDIAISFGGASHVTIDVDGGLVIATERGDLRQPAPAIYQDVNGARQSVAGAFVIDKAGRVRFRVGRYDRRLPLVIDPVLTYSTYLGGGGGDAAMGVAVDSGGNIYLAGETASLDFPHQNGAQPASGGGSLDAFVVKLNAAGDQLVYATYLGGSNYEYAKDVAVDASGNAYVTGSTTSPNFPTLHALQSTLRGISDGFVTKLDATGVIVYSTYLGGNREDYAYGIAVDAAGRAHVTGLLHRMSAIGESRYLWIAMDLRDEPTNLMVRLAHELRHALEILSDASIRTDRAILSFYNPDGESRDAHV